jgi:uncharacterized protein with NAD-binding domain and iron-sulfur cluster
MKHTLDQRGVQIRFQTYLPDLRFGQDGISGIYLRDGTQLNAQWYVTALSPQKLLALLPERLLTRYAYFAQLSELETLPELTVQSTCRATIRTPQLLLLVDQSFHQSIITSLGPQEIRCRLSVIGNTALTELQEDQLIELGKTELHALYSNIGTDGIQSAEVYRDDQAALSLRPGAALLRPIQRSPIQNLLVAGAWTDTGWPATVESAVVSAKRCMEIIAGRPA